jgi:hypothetical protein
MPAKKLSCSNRLFLVSLCGSFISIFSSSAIAELSIGNITFNPTIALTQTSIPIDGFVPQVVFGITDATGNSQEYDTLRQPTMIGTPLPIANPYYTLGIFDTGANINLLSWSVRTGFGLTDVGAECTLSGAGPDAVTADILSSAGYFANGLQALYNSGATPNTAGLKGVSNVRSAGAQQGGAELPTVLGAPFAVHYTTVIRTNETYTGTYNGTTYTTPKLDFYNSRYDAGVPTFDYRLQVTYCNPEYLPATYIPEDFGDILPATPTVSTQMLVESDLNHNNRFAGGSFLFDTGAQVTVLSLDKAIDLGLNLSQPQFTVEVAGIGGTNEEVPGFYIETLTLPAIGGVGNLVFNNVPVIALNVESSSGGFLDGIIGMNLFTDRNLVIDAGYQSASRWGNAFIGVGGVIGVPGDANHDSLIDVGDLGILAANYGRAGYASWEMGDFNHDGLIDVGDLGILAANYGYGSLTGVNPLNLSTINIPEPTTLVLLGLGGIGKIVRRRRKI